MSEQRPSNQCDVSASEPTSYVVEGNTYRELIAERDRLRIHLRQKSEQITRLQDGIEKMQQGSAERIAHEPPVAQPSNQSCDGNHAAPPCGDRQCWHGKSGLMRYTVIPGFEGECDINFDANGEWVRFDDVWPELQQLRARASSPPAHALVCIGQLIQLDDGLGTVFADWNEERFKLEPGAKLYAQRTLETKSEPYVMKPSEEASIIKERRKRAVPDETLDRSKPALPGETRDGNAN